MLSVLEWPQKVKTIYFLKKSLNQLDENKENTLKQRSHTIPVSLYGL